MTVRLFTDDQNSDRHGYPDIIATNVTQEVAEAIKAAFEEAGRGFILGRYDLAVQIDED